MQSAIPKSVTTAIFLLLFGAACRSPIRELAKNTNATDLDPCIAARTIFSAHYNFYCSDPNLIKTLVTPRVFFALKHNYETCIIQKDIGILDYDPWTDAQDGDISEPFKFATIQKDNSNAVVRFNYTFKLDSKSSRPQSIIIKFHRSPSSFGWLMSDFLMPNNESLVETLEKNP